MRRYRSDDRALADRIHHGHLILGMIALAAGEVEEANGHLLNACQSPGSPHIHGPGSTIVLAMGLRECGDTERFISYLALWSKFWISKKGALLLPRWLRVAKAGEIVCLASTSCIEPCGSRNP